MANGLHQEYKVTNLATNESVFFFAHGFRTTAFYHMKNYVARNQKKFPMRIFGLNYSDFGPKWKPLEITMVLNGPRTN